MQVPKDSSSEEDQEVVGWKPIGGPRPGSRAICCRQAPLPGLLHLASLAHGWTATEGREQGQVCQSLLKNWLSGSFVWYRGLEVLQQTTFVAACAVTDGTATWNVHVHAMMSLAVQWSPNVCAVPSAVALSVML